MALFTKKYASVDGSRTVILKVHENVKYFYKFCKHKLIAVE